MLNIQGEYDANIELTNTGKVSKIENNWTFVPLESGHTFNEPKILFAKIDEKKVD